MVEVEGDAGKIEGVLLRSRDLRDWYRYWSWGFSREWWDREMGNQETLSMMKLGIVQHDGIALEMSWYIRDGEKDMPYRVLSSQENTILKVRIDNCVYFYKRTSRVYANLFTMHCLLIIFNYYLLKIYDHIRLHFLNLWSFFCNTYYIYLLMIWHI